MTSIGTLFILPVVHTYIAKRREVPLSQAQEDRLVQVGEIRGTATVLKLSPR